MIDPVVTAVICTRNRARFLEKCLASLLNQKVEDQRYEILVIDNGSSDTTAEVVKELQNANTSVRYVYEPVPGLSKARNTGWRRARGAYVGYIDDDAVVSDKWVSSVLWVIDNISPIPVWIGGPIELDWGVPNPGWIDDELKVPLGFINWGQEPRVLSNNERLGGGNSIYNRAELERLGGFDERLGRKKDNLLSGEETQLQKIIEEDGGKLYYHPGITIYHWVSKERVQPKWFYRRYYWGGVSDYFMNKTLANRAGPKGLHRERNDLSEEQGRWTRIISNLINSLGFFSTREDTVQARIYLSYVFGYGSGIYRWQLKKLCKNEKQCYESSN